MENPPAHAPVTINWIITEENAQRVINVFEWAVRNGGLAIGKEVQPIANDLMETAIKAKEAREAAAKAGDKPEESTKN